MKPVLNLEQEYSDNFYRVADDEVAVWVTRVSPGIIVDFLTDRSRVNFDYRFNYYFHTDSDDAVDASEDDFAGHDLSLYAATRLFTRLAVGIDEEFFLTREPGTSDPFAQYVERDKYWRNRLMPFVLYDIAEKGEVKVSYRNEVIDFTDPATTSESSVEHRGIITGTYHLNDTNHLDLENQFWNRDYDGAFSDYDSYQGKLIYRHEFNTYFTGEVGAGYHKRWFEDSGLDDVDAFAFHMRLKGETERTKVDLRFERNINDFTRADDYFTAHRVDLRVERLFLDVIRPYVGGYYQNSDYEFTDRQDDLYNTFVGVGYLFWDKRLELIAEYDYTERDSSIAVNDYTENRVFLRLNAHYDWPR